MTNQLMVANQTMDFETLQRQAIALAASEYFPDAKDKAKAIAKVMAGAELGIAPFASMSGIDIIKGKPRLSANLVATLIDNHPDYEFRVNEQSDTVVSIDWYKHNEKRGTSTYTIEEAQRAGLATKDNWQKYPSDMLFARAISRGARRFAPGIFGGIPVYSGDELEDDKEVIESEAVVIEVNPESADDSKDIQETIDSTIVENHIVHSDEVYKELHDAVPANVPDGQPMVKPEASKTVEIDPALVAEWRDKIVAFPRQDIRADYVASIMPLAVPTHYTHASHALAATDYQAADTMEMSEALEMFDALVARVTA